MNIIYYIKKKAESHIIKNLTILAGGSTLAQIIGVLLSPIIARLYTPSNFGVVGSLLAFTSIISFIASLKYDLAIVLEQDDDDANSLIDLNVLIAVIFTLIASGLLFSSSFLLDYLDDKPNLVKLFPYSLPIILFSALYNIYTAKFNREKEYKKIALYQIIRKLSATLFQILFGFFFASALGLVLGTLLGVVIPFVILFFSKKTFQLYNFSSVKNLKKIAKKHSNFPIYITPQSFINLLSTQFPVFVLGYYFNLEVVGAYFFTLKLVQVPSAFIGKSFRQVFYQEAAEKKNDLQSLKRLFTKITLSLTVIISTSMMILMFYGEVIFTLVFGSEWVLAGSIVGWMFLWYGSNIIAGSARSLFLIFEKQKLILIIDSVLFIIRFGSLILLSRLFDSITVIKWFSIIPMIFNIFVICFWLFFFKKKSNLNV